MKVILFDFFGVLSTPVYKRVVERFIPESERAAWMEKFNDLDLDILSEENLVKQIAEKAAVSEGEIWQAVKDAPRVNQELFHYIESELKQKYRVGLLTNIPKSLLERVIPDKLSLFDPLLISSELQLLKPSKEIFEVAIRRCGVLPREILFTDDSQKNIEVAASLGIDAIVYQDFPSLVKQLEERGVRIDS